MSKSNPTPVSAARVREAYREGLFTVPEAGLACLIGRNGDGKVRGRLNPITIESFNNAGLGEVYAGEKSGVESKSVTLPLTKMNAAGAVLKRPEDFAPSEVRRLAGIEGKKGRIGQADLTRAAEAVVAERGWNVKPTGKASKGSKAKA